YPLPPTSGGIRGIYPFNFTQPPTFGGIRGIYPFKSPQQTNIIISYTTEKPPGPQANFPCGPDGFIL
ncbi:hypothetical protein, partial [Paenibacillus phytohabitans]|uniref:hypothetical protein n=1 Tax=Paenibacillus phytohabitans TaxID=2654978 RepID=UPI003009C3C6